MGTKNEPGEYDCHAKAEPDEPLFTLIGRDPTASLLVSLWVLTQEQNGKQLDDPKLVEATHCAIDMESWAYHRVHPAEVASKREAFKRAVIELAKSYQED